MLTVADLPPVRGTYTAQAPLAPFTWMRVGGPAGVLFRPADEADLADFLKHKPAHIPHFVIGAASNLIIRDGGLPDTVVIKLAKGFGDLDAHGQTLTAGAAQLDLNVAKFAAKNGIGGLSFLAGVPGTIGGAVRMNAGARTTAANAHIAGGETADRLKHARVLDPNGTIHTLTPQDMGMSYRHNDLPDDWIITAAVFEGAAQGEGEGTSPPAPLATEDPATPAALMKEIEGVLAYRNDNQPTKARTCGSTFKNPDGQSAWKLVDAAGGRGLRRGDAEMSDFHCNFLLNLGHATAADLEDLGDDIRARVRAQSGIDLQWEVKRVGNRA